MYGFDDTEVCFCWVISIICSLSSHLKFTGMPKYFWLSIAYFLLIIENQMIGWWTGYCLLLGQTARLGVPESPGDLTLTVSLGHLRPSFHHTRASSLSACLICCVSSRMQPTAWRTDWGPSSSAQFLKLVLFSRPWDSVQSSGQPPGCRLLN